MQKTEFSWLDQTEYPFESRWFEIHGNRFHYVDEGSGEILLFIHGTPSWSFDYRNIIRELRKTRRCVALDHLGFGLSDKPEKYNYSTQDHSATLEKFILEKNLQNITLVVHDFGGPIGLNVATRYPERFKQIVILNSWLWSSEGEPDFEKFKKILRSPLLPFLYRKLNFSARYILPRSFGDHRLKRSLRKFYTSPFADSSQRNGTLAFAYSLLNDQNWFEELWKKRERLAEKRVLIIWGMKDPVISPAYLEKFITGFPEAKVVRLNTCGHFPQEECPEEVSQALKEFLVD